MTGKRPFHARRIAVPLAALLGLLATACSEKDCGPEGCCTTSLDCAGGRTCDAEKKCVIAPSCTGVAGCVGDDVCSPNGWCDSLPRIDPGKVAIFGAVNDDPPLLGAAPLDQPSRLVGAVYNSGDAVIHRAALDGLGRVLYLETFIDASSGTPVLHRSVRRIVPDPWTWLGDSWWLWGALRANDEVIHAPCDPVAMAGRPGSSDVYLGCPEGVVGPDGTLLLEGAEPVAVNEAGAVLAVRDGALVLRTPAGVELPVLQSTSLEGVLTARAYGDGFRVVAFDPFQRVARRWVVSGTGALEDGAAYPARSCAGCEERAVDPEGAVYRAFTGLDANNRLVSGLERCTPGRCARVYVPQHVGAGADDKAVPPVRYVFPMPPLQCAITGP